MRLLLIQPHLNNWKTLHFTLRTTKDWFIKWKKASQRLGIMSVLYNNQFGKYNIACDACDNIVSIDDSLVILTPLQKKILYTLHLAPKELQIWLHMQASVHWPEINNSIYTTWYSCKSCNEVVPLNPKETLILLSLPPE